MSYCRFSEGDVYMYRSNRTGLYICCGCNLINPEENMALKTPEEALSHLEDHVLAWDIVPERAFTRLKKEIEEKKQEESVEYRINACDVDGTENPTGNHYKVSRVVPKPGSPYGWNKHTSNYRILRKGTWQWVILNWLVDDNQSEEELLAICYHGA